MTLKIGRVIRQFLFRSDSAGLAIPTMDGALMPNELLTSATKIVDVTNPRDMAMLADDLFIAAENTIWKANLNGSGSTKVISFEKQIGAITSDNTNLYAAVVGLGIVRIEVGTGTFHIVSALPLLCPTALAILGDRLLLAEGSTEYGIDDWAVDLMKKGSTGSISMIDLVTGRVQSLLTGIQYCAGIAFTPSGEELVYSEAWAHRLMTISLSDKQIPKIVTNQLPAYPGRITRSSEYGYWLSAFAVRTHLVEFVLVQDDYRLEMIRTIPKEFWIRPYLRPSKSGLDPLQGGQLKKLGATKPWAPARSYGLVILLNSDFQPIDSFHSRAGGEIHGIVQAVEYQGALIAAAVGGDCVVKVPIGLINTSREVLK